MMVLTFVIQTCLHSPRFAKMIRFVEETHDPNKQVNTSPTQQSFSASPLLFLLLPSTVLLFFLLHTNEHTSRSRSSVAKGNQTVNESVMIFAVLYEFDVCRGHRNILVVVVIGVLFFFL